MDNAVEILDAAESAVRSGQAPSDMTILITQEGGIRMVADSDWPLDSLQAPSRGEDGLPGEPERVRCARRGAGRFSDLSVRNRKA